MTTHLITTEIDLKTVATDLNRAIESELRTYGEPLRWAITDVDADQIAKVEAVVTRD